MDTDVSAIRQAWILLRLAAARLRQAATNAAFISLIVCCGLACSEQRNRTTTARAEAGHAPTTQPSPGDDYVSRAVLEMAAEDQQRSAQSLEREPPVRYRDSPIRPPQR